MSEVWADGYRAGLGSAIITIDRRAAQLPADVAAILTDLADALRIVSARVIPLPPAEYRGRAENAPQTQPDGKNSDDDRNAG